MICSNCKNEVSKEDRFCVYCGQEIFSCPFCYATFDEKTGKCPSCNRIIKERVQSQERKNIYETPGNERKKLFWKNYWFWVSIIIIVLIVWMIAAGDPEEKISEEQEDPVLSSLEIQRTITPSVVNIVCENYLTGDVHSGSGVIIDEDGIIITNSHIIPQDEEFIYTEGCLVALSIFDDDFGIFWADPVVIPGLSDEYDLAFMYIYDAYYDDEEELFYGTYPRKFPEFDDSDRCWGNVELGEPIRIIGYPDAGDFSLVVTEGIISFFTLDGLIMTSAKISSGNSGGIAIDRHGCMIGIPSMVSIGKHENLGVIIPKTMVYEFMDKYAELLINI